MNINLIVVIIKLKNIKKKYNQFLHNNSFLIFQKKKYNLENFLNDFITKYIFLITKKLIFLCLCQMCLKIKYIILQVLPQIRIIINL